MKPPTLQDLRRAYMRAARLGDIAASPATARKNFNELLGIAAAAQIKETDKIARLSPDALRAWRLREYARAGLSAPDPLKNYRLNCHIRQAQSVFSADALRAYAAEKLPIAPCALAFAREPKLRPEARQTFRPIPEEADAAIKAAARSALSPSAAAGECECYSTQNEGRQGRRPLKGTAPYGDCLRNAPIPAQERATPETKPQSRGGGGTETLSEPLSPLCALMIEMARLCGMTVKEIHHFRRAWVVESSNGIFIDIREDGEFYTKRAAKNRQIPLAPEVWARWRNALPADGGPAFGEYGAHTNPESVYSQTCRFLRQYLPDRRKKLHELRKMACSDILARERDIYAAARFIGDRVDTAAKYYAAQIRPVAPLS